MSSDQKLSTATAAPSARLFDPKMWTDRLMPVLGQSLLPDLVRVIAEYCPLRLAWDPQRRSKRIAITDADADADGDGTGRSLQFLDKPPAGMSEAVAPGGWDAIHSVAPLSELSGTSVTWGVRIDLDSHWGYCLTVGVARPTAKVLPGNAGADDQTYAVYQMNSIFRGVHANAPVDPPDDSPTDAPPPPAPPPAPPAPHEGQRMVIRLTADLSANTVRFAVEIVTADAPHTLVSRYDRAEWCFPVPDLAQCHLSAASCAPMRLTLMD
jgi:hypothetical protein